MCQLKKKQIICTNCGKPFDDADLLQNAHVHMPVNAGKYKGQTFDAYYCVECMDTFIDILCGTSRTDPLTGENNHEFTTWEADNV